MHGHASDTNDIDSAGHRARLRKRLLAAGPEGFHDYELLEYLLALTIPRVDTKPLAKRLIHDFGGIGRRSLGPRPRGDRASDRARRNGPDHRPQPPERRPGPVEPGYPSDARFGRGRPAYEGHGPRPCDRRRQRPHEHAGGGPDLKL